MHVHVQGVHRLLHILTLYMEVDLSNCPAPADTITSGADPAADRNKESVAGFDLAKLCDYEFKIPQPKRDEAIRFGISQHPKHFPVDKVGIDFPVTVLKHTNRMVNHTFVTNCHGVNNSRLYFASHVVSSAPMTVLQGLSWHHQEAGRTFRTEIKSIKFSPLIFQPACFGTMHSSRDIL